MSIRFKNVEKHYAVYARPQDRLWEWLTGRRKHRVFEALAGVDFAVQPGETFGLVGENGAGKSTLLKIAAGTIRPTRGAVERSGHVAALLELGAGFHPEESGYDNMRFMAALHGLGGQQMARFIEKAIAFSELPPEALARPVKTYSSGMFMRLAFAGATAIEPEVLIVDEALSVGDMHFQKKSLDRILALREAGATILFCSHNLYQIRSLCQRAAWIRDGRVEAIGNTEAVVTAYEAFERRRYARLKAQAQEAQQPAQPGMAVVATAAAGGGSSGQVSMVKLLSLRTQTQEGINPACVDSFEDLTLELDLEAYGDMAFHVGVSIVRADKDNVFGTSTQFRPQATPLRGAGAHSVRIRFPALPLLSGEYLWSVYILDDSGIQVLDMAELIQPFKVLNSGKKEFGLVWLDHQWLACA
ncbi:MAG: ABC transporter ATP-binding protein [Burkholderiaceae bacterium]|jgi:lipopolysaccharide transport system ATP-binding protein|nr:ABC transporter ATP-binding protein [Burkholderiaceae bacterium]